MTSTMTREQAEALRAARDTDARLLSRKPKYELVAIYQSEGGYGGGTWSKDDLLGSILEMRFPMARQNEAIHVLHHEPGTVGSSACEWCRCQVTWRYRQDGRSYELLAQCTGQPGHDGGHQDGEHPEAGAA